MTLWTLLGTMAGSAFLSATLLPGSSEAILAGLLILAPEATWELWAVATLGNVLGSLLNWGLGWWCLTFLDTRWFPVTREQYERAARWFDHYGVWTLLLAWTPILGDPLTVVAGAFRVRLPLFLLLVAIGKAARYAFIVGGVFWWRGN